MDEAELFILGLCVAIPALSVIARLSANGVWRVLRRHGLNTRGQALRPGRRLRRTTNPTTTDPTT